MDVFGRYKPFRNKVSLLWREDALKVIWAYCQYLQLPQFNFPPGIQVLNRFLRDPVPQRMISEWELELLAKEVILNSASYNTNGSTLREWKTLATMINMLKELENDIYGAYGSDRKILIELIRMAHRQFVWQSNPPNHAATIRYFTIYNRPEIDGICLDRLNLTVSDIYLCGMAFMGMFIEHPAVNFPVKSDIRRLPVEKIDRFLAFTSRRAADLQSILKSEQRYDDKFAYAYNSLRAYPLVQMDFDGRDAIVCPLPTLLYWRITGGLYYELVQDPRFAVPYGDSFQRYVGKAMQRASSGSRLRILPEQQFGSKKAPKRTVDWIVADERAAIFVECKARRLSIGAKTTSLDDLTALEKDIDNMADALLQLYKSIAEYLDNEYPNFPFEEERLIYPSIVTLENWWVFGAPMFDRLRISLSAKMQAAGLPSSYLDQMPYSIFVIDDLETAVQIIQSVGIVQVFDGKLRDPGKQTWDWHGYMTDRFPTHFPVKPLFDDEYDDLFEDVA
jgi:hypothetical protein